MPRAARSFADDLRARSDEDLAGLLLARPDLARPAPTDITSLAARAQTRASVQRAVEHLDAGHLHLLEALLVVAATDAATALGATKKAVETGIRELWQLALVWRSADGWRPVRASGEVLTRPAGLGPSASDLGITASALAQLPTTPDAARAVENTLGERARTVVDQLRWGNSLASFTTPALRDVRGELVDAGIMTPLDADDAVIPREVGLALRGGRLYEQPWAPPTPSVPQVEPARVDDTAASAVTDLLWRLDDIATIWTSRAPRVLRTGGLSVRDHRALAVAIDASSDLTAFILECGHAAGLFAPDGEVEPSWRPTDFYDEWSEWPPARRWARLASAWLTTTRAPSLAGHTVDGTLVNVLGRDAEWPLLWRRRGDVLAVMRDLPAGSSPSIDTIEEMLRWRRPLRLPVGAPTHVDVVRREATWLGVLALDALSTPGRTLVEDPDAQEEAATALSAVLPEPISSVLVQGDLTAVAPGPLTEDVASFMRRAADIESRGGATVFRFTENTIRRLLDSGVSAEEALAQLARYSMTPIPQALDYLVHDIARRHGHLRVGSVSSYVRADDEHALDGLLADTSLASLRLRRIAPGVAVSPVPAATLLDALRAARHAPVAETSDGGVVVRTEAVRRAPTPRRHVPSVQVSTLDADAAARIATSMRTGEAHAVRPSAHDERTRIPTTDPTVTLTAIDDAIAEHVPVWIGYVDASGDIKRSLFHPERVDGGRVVGRLGQAKNPSTLSIHRITGVAQA